ncbi:MAG: hypothetical protein IJS68_03510, partial [Clostridia bacterium]|nr:hypothetical protein [Clostridia bacterium]
MIKDVNNIKVMVIYGNHNWRLKETAMEYKASSVVSTSAANRLIEGGFDDFDFVLIEESEM